MIGLREIPLLRLIFPFIVGLLMATFIQAWSIFELTAIVISVCVIQLLLYRFVKNKNFFASQCIWYSLILIGFSMMRIHQNKIMHYDPINEEQWMMIKIGAKVDESAWYHNYNVELQSVIDSSGEVTTIPQVTIAKFPMSDSLISFQIGQEYLVKAKMKTISKQTNPFAFDYSHWLYKKGITFQLYISEYEELLDSKIGTYDRFHAKLALVRSYLDERLDNHIDDKSAYQIATAMILGNRSQMDAEVYESFASTGAVHVLAVSGLHVGIVALLILSSFRLFDRLGLKIPKVIKVIITLMGIWAFALIAGSGSAVLRSAMMFSVFTIGFHRDKHTQSLNIIASAAWILLLINPNYLFDVGFQLSFAAVISIVFFIRYWSWMPKFNNKFKDFFAQLFVVTLAAQILVLPIVIFYFHRFPGLFWLSSLIAVPAAYIIVGLGILLLLVDSISCSIASWIAWIFEYVLVGLNKSINILSGFRWANVEDIWLSPLIMVFIYLSIFCWMRYLYSREMKWYIPTLSFCIPVALLFYGARIENLQHQSITIYDVYNGLLIDFFDKKSAFIFKSDDIKKSTEKYVAGLHRSRRNINDIQYLDQDSSYQTVNFQKRKNHFEFCDYKIYVPDNTKIMIDSTVNAYLLTHEFSKNPNKDLLASISKDQLVIIDKSVRPWDKDKYMSILDDHNVHDIHSQGAYYKRIK